MFIITYDPREPLSIGQLVEPPNMPKLQLRRVALLPVRAEALHRGPFSGYAQQHYGSGLYYTGNHPEKSAKLLVGVPPGELTLHWFARLEPIDASLPMRGSLKLMNETGMQTVGAGLSIQDRVDSLPDSVDVEQGASVKGSSVTSASMAGFLAVSLYGMCTNVRIRTFAVSVQ